MDPDQAFSQQRHNPHGHGGQPGQGSHGGHGDKCNCGQKHPGFCEMLRGPQRSMVLYSIFSGMICKGFLLTNPALMMIYQLYQQCKHVITSSPTQLFYQIQGSCRNQWKIFRIAAGSLLLPFIAMMYYNEKHVITKYVYFLKEGDNQFYYNLLLGVVGFCIFSALLFLLVDPGFLDKEWTK